MNLLILLSALATLLSNLTSNILQSDFSLTIQEKGQAPITAPGKIVMQGEQFVGSARGYEVAYDGKTFYMYDPDTKEISLSYPLQEELMTSNPLLYVKYLSEVSTIKETTSKDGTVTTITMVPQGTPDEQVKVTIKMKADMAQSVEINEPQRTTTLRLKNPHYITTAPSFTVSKPGAYINDLR